MYSVTILLPRKDNLDGEGCFMPISAWLREDIIKQLVTRCGGVTLSEAQGVWIDSQGEETTSLQMKVEVDNLRHEDVEWVRLRARKWAAAMKQKCLYVRVTKSDLYFEGAN